METYTKDLQELAARYPLRVRWSTEDNAFVGSIEGLAGDCHHGDDAREVFRTIQRLAVESVSELLAHGQSLPEVKLQDLDPDPATIRGSMGVSQSQFARLLGVSVKTLHKWEQHSSRPSGAARSLLRVAAMRPDAVREVLI